MPVLETRIEGHGPALVLVHGFLGGAGMWEGQFAALKSKFRIIAPNLAGFGDSAHLQAPDRIEDHASIVLDCLSELGIETFQLLGHSMGGMVVQQMAAMAPDRISKLILYGTGPIGLLPDRFEPIETSRQRFIDEGLEATAKRIAATWFRLGEQGPGYDICVREGAKATMQSALSALTSWEHWNGAEALKDFKMPCRIIWGDKDRSYGWPQAEALWRGIPNAELAVVPGAAHNVHMEKPRLFNDILCDFLD